MSEHAPSRDDTAPPASSPRISTRTFTIAAFVLCLVIACVVSIAASSSPDGLEFVADSAGFLDTAQDSVVVGGPFADYAFAGVGNPWLSVAIAGGIGCVATFVLAWVVGLVARRRRSELRTRNDTGAAE